MQNSDSGCMAGQGGGEEVVKGNKRPRGEEDEKGRTNAGASIDAAQERQGWWSRKSGDHGKVVDAYDFMAPSLIVLSHHACSFPMLMIWARTI